MRTWGVVELEAGPLKQKGKVSFPCDSGFGVR